MGLLDNQAQLDYYISGDYGGYQFTTLNNIINAFMVVYVGESKLLSKVSRTDVQFYAMRAIQELSYDVFRSIKSYEITVDPGLSFILPQDYVNYVKLVRVDNNGIERVLYPTGKTSNPFPISQNANGIWQFYTDGSIAQDPTLTTDLVEVPDVFVANSNTLDNWNSQTPNADVYSNDTADIEIDNRGRRYGLDPQHAQVNGTFYVDQRTGIIHLSSGLVGETVTLKYVSDGLGTDEEMVVHKFVEEACYKWIAYGILSSRSNIPEGIVQRFKKEKFAETRKAKIRLSNIKIEEFTQVLKGLSKPIK
jgi:hypothetical protein